MIPTAEEAFELLKAHNSEQFHLNHGLIVGDTMAWFAKDAAADDEVELWRVVGILHDVDFEEQPERHCVALQEILNEAGVDPVVVRACASHGWPRCVDIEPKSTMEKTLYAIDELTGLIGAVAVMRPSKSYDDLEVKSVKKKFKNLKFAAGCNREVIQSGAGLLGIELDELIAKTICALRESDNARRALTE